MSKGSICDPHAVDISAIGLSGVAEMIPARFQEDVGMMTRNGGFVDLQDVVRKSTDGHLLLAKVEVDPVVFGEKDLQLGHGLR